MALDRRLLALVCVTLMVSGCASNPWSQRRIQAREVAIQTTCQEIGKSEARRPDRLREAVRDIERKHQRDAVRFQDRANRAGDRIW